MRPRSPVSDNLADLQRRLLRLAELVDRAIVGALGAFTRYQISEAERVIASSPAIEELCVAIESEALHLLASGQRVLGRDLRVVSALLLVTNELERIGDYAKGIATVVLRSADLPRQEPPAQLHQMAHKAREMLQQAIRAVVTQDTLAVEQLKRADQHVDTLYRGVQDALWAAMHEQPQLCKPGSYLLWIAHSLERIADRSVTIAERAAFIATGSQRTAVSPQKRPMSC